jgi:putative peptide zinc metalloprotease protein
MYRRDTVVDVQPFTRQRDGEDVIIGRIDTGVFLAVPSEAVEVLEHLAQGKSVGEAADLHQQKYGETPDLKDFLTLLEAKGIVKSVGAQERSTDEHIALQQRRQLRYHFSSFPASLAQRLFGRPTLVLSWAIIVSAIALMVLDSSLAPRVIDLYFPNRRTLSWTILIVANYATLFVHEFGHLVAARALGINSRMGIGHRLWFVVAETDLTALWSVAKSKRYLPLLAGAIVDSVSGALLVILLFVQDRGWLTFPDLCTRLLRAMVFTYIMRLVWQCFLFLRTDFYYLIVNAFSCKNLMGDTEAFLRDKLARFLPWITPVDQSSIPRSERRVIRGYAVVWLAGRTMAFILLFTVTIPLTVRYVQNLRAALASGYSTNPYNFIDALLLALYFLVPLTAGLAMWIAGIVRHIRS